MLIIKPCYDLLLTYLCSVNELQIYKKMTIPQETIKAWESLKEDGDLEKLSEKTGKSKETIKRIFRNKEGKTEDILKINEFYKKRKEQQTKLLTEDDNN